jgi:photosystem II stability/assembly factor-like uncharacterized protein
MKYSKLIFIPIVIFTIQICGHTQTLSWEWQNPLPQGNRLKALDFRSKTLGYLVGKKGTILKGYDYNSWDFRTVSHDVDLNDVCIIDSLTVYTVGSGNNFGRLYRTTDGGQSWEMIYQHPQGFLSVYWVDHLHGWIGTRTGILRTVDGGVVWEEVILNQSIRQLYFANADSGWARTGVEIFRTANGGINWNSAFRLSGGFSRSIECASFISSNRAIFVGFIDYDVFFKTRIYQTNNVGHHWIVQHEYTYRWFNEIEFYNENVGWLLGLGDVWQTTDGGNSWNPIGSTGLNSISFADSLHGWGVGDYSTIYRTNDGGQTWTQEYVGFTKSKENFDIVDGNLVIFAGRSSILKSRNAQYPFQSIPLVHPAGKTGILTKIDFIDSLKAWAVFTNNEHDYDILKSEDGGVSWQLQKEDVPRLYDLQMFDENRGWFCSRSDGIYRTIDGGENWVRQLTPEAPQVECLFFLDSLTGWAGADDSLYYTVDGGKNWVKKSPGIPFYVEDIFFSNPQTGFVAGYISGKGILLKTGDGGSSWAVDSSLNNLTGPFEYIEFDPVYEQLGFLVSESKMFFTEDWGTNWTEIPRPVSSNLTKVKLTSDNKLVLLASPAAIVTTDFPVPTHIQSAGSKIKNIMLAQNYPNPFNSETAIRFHLPAGASQAGLSAFSQVEINIYNLLGQKVRTLANRQMFAGEHTVKWDGRDDAGREVASGIYIYRLRSNPPSKGGRGDAQSRKMLLLR